MDDEQSGLRNKRDVWTIPTQCYKGAHFATYPEALVRPCILAGCLAGGTVLDPFAAQPQLVLFCDVLEPSTGQPYSRDPRSIAKRAAAFLASTSSFVQSSGVDGFAGAVDIAGASSFATSATSCAGVIMFATA